MALFDTDEVAWSKWTSQFESRLPNTAPNIVQVNSVLAPLACQTQWPQLNLYRRLTIGDTLPSFTRANSGAYLNSGSTLSSSFEQYLLQLNIELRKNAPHIDQAAIDYALKKYNLSLDALRSFDRDAKKDWQITLVRHPHTSRTQWEVDYQYRDRRAPLLDAVSGKYSDYLALAAAYPPLYELAKALRAFNDPRQFMKLPMNEDEAQLAAANPNGGDEFWSEFRVTYLNFDVAQFLQGDAPETIQITESSSRSTTYESRWSASVGGGGAFWSFGGSAQGGTVDRRLRQDASRFAISFKKLIAVPIARKLWYDEKFVRAYCNLVKKEEYWNETGILSLIPQQVLVARGISIEIDVSAGAYTDFQNWYSASASGGFSVGPFRVGGGGSSSSSYRDIQNQSSGTTIKISDTSNNFYIIGVASLRPLDFVNSPKLRMAAEVADIDKAIGVKTAEWDNMNIALNSQGAAPIQPTPIRSKAS